MELLFSYGTLQQDEVQKSSFGRLLKGSIDHLPDYQLQDLEIIDPQVLKLSGKKIHPIASPALGHSIPGMVFEVSIEEIKASDEYEVSDYIRKAIVLQSGKTAWVYVNANTSEPNSLL